MPDASENITFPQLRLPLALHEENWYRTALLKIYEMQLIQLRFVVTIYCHIFVTRVWWWLKHTELFPNFPT